MSSPGSEGRGRRPGRAGSGRKLCGEAAAAGAAPAVPATAGPGIPRIAERGGRGAPRGATGLVPGRAAAPRGLRTGVGKFCESGVRAAPRGDGERRSGGRRGSGRAVRGWRSGAVSVSGWRVAVPGLCLGARCCPGDDVTGVMLLPARYSSRCRAGSALSSLARPKYPFLFLAKALFLVPGYRSFPRAEGHVSLCCL